jgi:hypothetical protein
MARANAANAREPLKSSLDQDLTIRTVHALDFDMQYVPLMAVGFGRHPEFPFDQNSLSGGVYFLRVRARGQY